MEDKTNLNNEEPKTETPAAMEATAGNDPKSAQPAAEEEDLFGDSDKNKKKGKDKKDKKEKKDKEKSESGAEPENAFEKQMKRRKRARRIKTVITILVLAFLGCAGYQGYMYLQKLNSTTEESTSSTDYRVQLVTEGSITSTVSYTGTMTPVTTETLYSDYDDSEVLSINATLNGSFKKGDVLITLELDEDNTLVTQLEDLEDEIAATDRVADSKYLRANAKGYIKDIKLYAGCNVTEIMEEYGYIALIDLDNLMQVFVKTDALTQYENVNLVVNGRTYSGVVQEIVDGKADIIIESSKPAVGAVAEVFKKDGTSAGTGTMELVSYTEITAVDGYVTSLNVKDGQLVRKNDKIALCRDYPTSSDYQDLIEDKEELQQDIDEVTILTAPFDGRVLEIDVAEGDTVDMDTTLMVLQSTEGYIVSLSVDELDIASIKLGQQATVELDALEGTYEGSVSYISYVNASSGNTVRYTVEVKLDDISGVLPEMSATCTIITADSGNGLIIPADAVQLVDGKSVVYLAPDGATFGQSYKETELDLTTLKTVEISVIQSDGSNLLVSGDLSKDDKILVINKTTTAVYSSDSSSESGFSFDMGGMMGGGGEMPGGMMGGGSSGSGRSGSESSGSGRSGSGSSGRSGGSSNGGSSRGN